MINYLVEFEADLVEFEADSQIISLEHQHQSALEISQSARNQERKSQIYFQSLALFAFEEWLIKREPSISIYKQYSSILQPEYANIIDAVCNLRAGEFKVCIIPTISFTDDEVIIPRAVVDLPEFVAHFYIVIGIEEELELASIRGFLRYDELVKYKSELQIQADWNYQLPFARFNRNENELLLYLRCLAPTAIPLPEVPSNRQATLRKMQAVLLNMLPQSYNRPLWQVLTWEQGVAVLTTPDLLSWLNQSRADNAALTSHLSDLLQILTQQAVNVKQWLRYQTDEIVQALSWQVLPAPSTIGTRTTQQRHVRELEDTLTDIKRSNALDIPTVALRAYQDILLESQLRLYAVAWSLPNQSSGSSEWTLLLVLKVISDHQPFSRFMLRISDQTGVLAEEELQPSNNHEYIFTQVEGSYQDKFLATITTASGQAQTLPPFEFPKE
jgi:hypothetical protein